MTFALYAITVSPHQLPLAREIVSRLGADNYRYIYTDQLPPERVNLGWGDAGAPWLMQYSSPGAAEWLRDADVVMMQHHRDWNLLEDRLSRGKTCLYPSERWFKPCLGMLRLLWPRYFMMARRFVRMLEKYDRLLYLPQGIHAARDMARLCGLMHGDLRCVFRAPKLEFARQPGGRIFLTQSSREAEKQRGSKYCLEKMRMWGYFVEKQLAVSGRSGDDAVKLTTPPLPHSPTLKVLWVGRFLDWKRVDTIIRAMKSLVVSRQSLGVSGTRISLDVYGTGPEEERLKKMAKGYEDVIRFHRPVPIGEVRKLMREHDVYVLASDAHEGWGAVVSEALEEWMKVIGTYEAGSSATMLPKERLFHAGDWRALANLLQRIAQGKLKSAGIGAWTAKIATKELLDMVQYM